MIAEVLADPSTITESGARSRGLHCILAATAELTLRRGEISCLKSTYGERG